jgi:hypothetical protein
MAASAAAARTSTAATNTAAGSPARAPRRTPARAPRRKSAPRPRARNAAVAGAALLPHAAVGAAGAVRDLSDSGLIMRLTRGRGWIAVLCVLLGGIVTLNVLSLSLTASSGRYGVQIDRLETQNSILRAEIAERLSASRVETAASTLGLANPDPEEISYLSAKDADAEKLARLLSTGDLLTEPSQPSSYPDAGESYGLAPLTPSTDTTTTTPAPSPSPGAGGAGGGSTGTSSGGSSGTAPSGTTGGVGL